MSAIDVALDLQEEHIQQWMPYVTGHGYWTRAEKKRVYAAILERDQVFVRHHLGRVSNPRERVCSAINILVYLTGAQLLLHNEKFRGIMTRKLCEFEADAHKLDSEYKYQLLHVVGVVRGILSTF